MLVHETDALITYLPRTPLLRPVEVAGEPVLEDGSPAVWFTFPGRWHDIGRFHRADGTFTGYYANILTPVNVEGDVWHTTDLFLDVFVTPTGSVHLLDVDELDAAERAGWVDVEDSRRARMEADRLMQEAVDGVWPPAVVRDWPLERAHSAGTPPRPPV